MKDADFLKVLSTKNNGAPLLIADFNVLLWKIIFFYEEYQLIYRKNRENIVKLATAYIFNRGLKYLPVLNYRVVVVADGPSDKYGGYWRHHEVQCDSRIQKAWDEYQPRKRIRSYKGGRGEKPDNFYFCYDIAMDYCKRYLNFFKFDGYEADDIAGSIYRSEKVREQKNRTKIFYTVDRDWNQLVDDNYGFYWYSLRDPRENEMFQYRAMNNDDVLEYSEKKLNHTISHPSDLAIAKAINGDLGDGLPPNSPIEYMELTKAHPKYNLEREFPQLFSELINETINLAPNNNLDHLSETEKVFKNLNLSFDYRG